MLEKKKRREAVTMAPTEPFKVGEAGGLPGFFWGWGQALLTGVAHPIEAME